ncbi:MAG: PD-(D/E)XK nuclease family protein [Patescibacteria group bacterium]
MSQYYHAKRVSGLFDPKSKIPFRLSRSKIDLFMECPRCFYLDRRLGIGRPPGFPFTLNSAVDALLKKEFDLHRAKGSQHPLMKTYHIDAIPLAHEKINEWRDALRGGITYLHQPTNFMITGGIDDVWQNSQGELIIVDYKATAKESEVNIDADWQMGYKRQIEIYQWLFRQNKFPVSDTGYFVYVNGKTDCEAFDGRLEFDIKIIPYQGDDHWVELEIIKARKCLEDQKIPVASPNCDYCAYRSEAQKSEKNG